MNHPTYATTQPWWTRIDNPLGLGAALLSAALFSTSGGFAKALMNGGWAPSTAVTARIVGAALVLTIPALILLRGRFHVLKRHLALIVMYGAIAVAGCQLFFFYAVSHLPVGVALLIEYVSPVLVVLWLWGRHGHRPRLLTVAGMASSVFGLAIVANLTSTLTGNGTPVSWVGLGWGAAAAIASGAYFFLAAAPTEDLHPLVLVASGMWVAAIALVVAGAVGLVPVVWNLNPVPFAGTTVSPLVPVAGLVALSGVTAYVLGAIAARELGPKVASFLSLLEVVLAFVLAWLLIGESPTFAQVLGGVFILGGAVLVKIDESRVADVAPDPEAETAILVAPEAA